MNFSEKKQAYGQLQGQEHLEADKELLLNKSPKSPALNLATIDRNKAQREILWALLDVASFEEIKESRKPEVGSHKDQVIDLMNVARENAIKKLIEIDIETATQPVIANIARSIQIETPDYKAATLRPLLKNFKDLLVIAENADDSAGSAIEELEGKVEDLESENEDLQEQLDEKEAELEETAAELAEAKKKAQTDPV